MHEFEKMYREMQIVTSGSYLDIKSMQHSPASIRKYLDTLQSSMNILTNIYEEMNPVALLNTFLLFHKLPMELRLKVWKLAMIQDYPCKIWVNKTRRGCPSSSNTSCVSGVSHGGFEEILTMPEYNNPYSNRSRP